jgi:rhodanese-related sulfurtransferase
MNLRHNGGLVIAIIVTGVAVPLLLYEACVGRAPCMASAKVDPLLKARTHVLVDIGVNPDLAVYLQDAVMWPVSSIVQAHSTNDVPTQLKGRKLLLICTAGIQSAKAALHLQSIGVDAVSVRGGAQQFLSAVPGCSRSILLRGDPSHDAIIPVFRASPVYEQWAVVVAFFGIKTIYSLMALGIVGWLWHRKEADLSAIRWAMIFFFVGEAFCFLNVMVFFEDSMLLEHLHSVGMVLSLGYASYALFEGLDGRLIHFSDDSRCAATGLCRICDKRTPTACGLRRLFLLLIPATALLAAIPLFSGFREAVYNTRILGILHSYRHPVIHQFYELRFLPLAALVLLAASFAALWRFERRSVTRSKILYSAALGAIGFSLFRLLLVASFLDDQVWFVVWEETTELMYVGLVGGVLMVFARGLLAQATPNRSEVRA